MNVKTTTRKKDSPTQYKQKLLDARTLRQQGGGLLFDRVTLLCEVFEDRDFRADLGNVDDVKAAEVLDQEVDDTGFDFLQLRQIMQANPDRHAWKKTRLSDLYQAVLEAHRKAEPGDAPIRTRRSIRVADYQQLETDLTKTRDQLQHMEVETEVLKRRVSELDRLRTELTEARRRIAELERDNARLTRELRRLQDLRELVSV